MALALLGLDKAASSKIFVPETRNRRGKERRLQLLVLLHDHINQAPSHLMRHARYVDHLARPKLVPQMLPHHFVDFIAQWLRHRTRPFGSIEEAARRSLVLACVLFRARAFQVAVESAQARRTGTL